MGDLNHFDNNGNARMVNVGGKAESKRTATAEGFIALNQAAFAAVKNGSAEKGDVLGVARVAGIMAVKRTSDLIPLCHPLLIEKATLDFDVLPESGSVRACCTVQTTGKTGVEIEALTGVQIALLTIYDMCKSLDRGMTITDVRLLEKDGGASGHYTRQDGDK